MQPIAAPPKAGKIAFQQGLIFGLIQAVIASLVLLVNDIVITSASQVGISLLLSALSFLTGLAAYFVAGIFAAKQTGKVSTGTFAGMWTGAIYGVIGFIVSATLFVQVVAPRTLDALSSTQADPSAFKTGFMIGGIGFEFFGILLAIGFGAGLGALGGLIGRNISPLKPAAVVPVYAAYPGAVPPVYPTPTPPQPAGTEQVYTDQPIVNPYAENPYSNQQPQ